MAYKKKEKPGIMLYWDAFNALEDMVDGEAKQMLRAMPKNSTLKKIADYFNVTVDDLLTGDLTSDLSNVDNQQVSTIEEALINLTRCFVEMPKELQEEALKHLSMLVKVLGAEKNSPQNESPNNPPEDEK